MENKQIIPVMLLEDGRAGEWHIEDPIEAALYMDKWPRRWCPDPGHDDKRPSSGRKAD